MNREGEWMTYIDALLKVGEIDVGVFAGFLAAWLDCPGEISDIAEKLKKVLPKSSEELFNKNLCELSRRVQDCSSDSR